MIPPTVPPDREMSPISDTTGARVRRWAGTGGKVVAGMVAFGMLGMGIYSMMNEPGLPTKPVDTGAAQIAQTVANPPTPKTEEPPATVKKDLPKTEEKHEDKPPPTVASNFVVYPASGSGGSFDVPPPDREGARAEGGTARAGGLGTDEKVPQTRVDFQATTLTGGKASLAMDMTYKMMPTTIPCSLDFAMESTLAGPIFCHTTEEVLSPRRVRLLPIHTQIVGTYKNDIKAGQHRLFSFAGSAYTEEGIAIPLNSSIADGLGRVGIEGDLDPHNGPKFGAAVALTAAQAAIQLGQAALSKGGNQTNFNFNSGGSGGVEGLALEILRSQEQIQPTISVPPGQIVQIVVDHIVSFDGAVHVEARR